MKKTHHDQVQYQPKTLQQLRNWFNGKNRRKVTTFSSFEDFCKWYQEEKKCCAYCGLTEEESQQIVKRSILTSKRFPQNGEVLRGKARGMWLEIDRKDPNGIYSEENCVLCCYFCNNDKSDVFDENQYRMFAGEKNLKQRAAYLRKLLTGHSKNIGTKK